MNMSSTHRANNSQRAQSNSMNKDTNANYNHGHTFNKNTSDFTQQQTTMDSETLDKLLMAEKHLFNAGQATLQAWKMIGRTPEDGNHMHTGPPPLHSSSTTVNMIQKSQQSNVPSHHLHHKQNHNLRHSYHLEGESNVTHVPRERNCVENSTGTLIQSPRLPIEIPRRDPMYPHPPTSSSGLYEKPISYPMQSTLETTPETTINTSHSDPSLLHRTSPNLFGFSRDLSSRSETSVFTFTVRKSDSVLEKLGSKKASIQLQVDSETRMLNFISPHDTRESYSCAAITARPQSKLGMQLKIQTGTTSVTKKIVFFSMEDRMNFMDALEQGKVMCKKTAGSSSYRNDESFSDDSGGIGGGSGMSGLMKSGNGSSYSNLREAIMDEQFSLLPGEIILEHVQRVTNLVVMSQSDRAVQGVLKITSYRITFAPYDSTWKFGSFEVPLATIDMISRDGLMMLISCKDLRTIRLAMHDAYTRKKGFDQFPSTPDFRWLNLLLLRMKPPTAIGSLFAFDYYQEKKEYMRSSSTKEDGWSLFSPVAEYQRLGFLRGGDAQILRKMGHDNNVITWRLLKNAKFRFSPTYPQLMVVPSLMSEEQLVQSARFRSRARLPIVVWRHPVNKCVLARSSQPNYGMAGNRSEPDRILLRAYRDAANKNSAGMSPPLHVIDARKPIASKGNRLKGKGVENSQHYDNAIIEFMNIANIHKMRDSLDLLRSLVSPNTVDDGDKHYHNRLENTRWLKHIMRVLSGARRVAEVLHEDGASVLVHCSDGWDRTPQLVALAQLILDPYYRTIRGFAVLVEKEWCSFGHKFADRIGVGKDASDLPNERSPVMLQFLDCVWQMTRQFPTAFEFNEKFLLHVSDALVTGLYGTFLYNCERERVLENIPERTESVWTTVLENPTPFKNPTYRGTNRVIYPRANLKRVVLWDAMFFRWDPESHPDYMEFMYPINTEDEENGEGSATIADGIEVAEPIVGEMDEEEKALQLEIDEILGFDEFRMKTALSDCSDMSDDDDVDDVLVRKSIQSARESLQRDIGTPKHVYEIDDEVLERYQRGAEERTRQRAQGRNIREAIQMAPDQSRIKYLEQLLSESVARELQLEAELDSIHYRLSMQRASASSATKQ